MGTTDFLPRYEIEYYTAHICKKRRYAGYFIVCEKQRHGMTHADPGDRARNDGALVRRAANIPPAHKPAARPTFCGDTGLDLVLINPIVRQTNEARVLVLREGRPRNIPARSGTFRKASVAGPA